jgi:hypothetical protein
VSTVTVSPFLIFFIALTVCSLFPPYNTSGAREMIFM